jgi:hypothetical protein
VTQRKDLAVQPRYAGVMIAMAIVFALAGFAAADPPPPGAGMTISVEVRSPVLGELTITPPAGTDTTPITVTTSAGCANPSDGFSVLLYGPGAFARGVLVVEPTGTGFSTTSPITAPLQRTLADAAAELDTTLVAGNYRLLLVCLDRTANKASGMFAGVLFVTSPTTYQTTPPPTTTTPAPTTTEPAVPSVGGGLSYTGAAVAGLLLTGLVLAGTGVAFVLVARRRSVPRLTEES